MLSIKDVADALNINPMTVFRYIQKGRIKAVKVGRDWRISAEELERIKKEGM